jgi:dihydrolipoamide dehydrogenase
MNPKRVVVIGGGPGGYVAAIRAAQLGARVTLVEKDRIGGTCLNRGCIPTKALLADAKTLLTLRRSPVFQSLVRDDFNPLGPMMERKARVVEEMLKGIEFLLQSHRVTVRNGRADLLNPKEVSLSNETGGRETIPADGIILAPGSKSKNLPTITPDGRTIITSDEALELTAVPQSTVVIGGGYIGVELATLLNALGSRVTIVEVLDNILPGLEGELVRHLRRVLDTRGIRVPVKSTVEEISTHETTTGVIIKTPDGIEQVSADKLLLSVGREPNLELNFSMAGIKSTPAGIEVNDRMETATPSIYAVGDAVGGVLLAHVASEQGVIAAENMMGISRKLQRAPIPLCIFTHPEIASIGLTEKEAKAKGEIKIGRFPFRSSASALISEETEGLIKVIASKENNDLLGVHMIGQAASVMIAIAAAMMRQGVKVHEFARYMQAHPTPPEALREAALDVDGIAIHLPRPLRTGAKR